MVRRVAADAREQRRRIPSWALAVHEALKVWRLRARAAEGVETDWDERTGDREAQADPQRDFGAGAGGAADGGGEGHEHRSDHERGDRAEELDDREHPLQARGREREPRDEQ